MERFSYLKIRNILSKKITLNFWKKSSNDFRTTTFSKKILSINKMTIAG